MGNPTLDPPVDHGHLHYVQLVSPKRVGRAMGEKLCSKETVGIDLPFAFEINGDDLPAATFQ